LPQALISPPSRQPKTITTVILTYFCYFSGKVFAMNSLLDRITIDSQICHGKFIIRDLKYPVKNILELLASGMTMDALLLDYPDLKRGDFLA